ncbi:hypothetical protein [Candidatus Palauibacter sp.]|uniref:hypothetical protein n=1 Tax=Candidatus Palauibacter sp. TaxID=3101350 RepID=UPI003CC6DAEE
MTTTVGDTCGAKTRGTGLPCRRPAGWGTEHAGHGTCKLHGGASVVRHGRYSRYAAKRAPIRELLEKHRADPDPTDVLEELALARALLEDWLDRYTAITESLLAWHAAGGAEDTRPARVPQLREIMPLLDTISKIVKRVEDVKASNAISRADFARVMTEMGRVVATLADPELAERIKLQWLSIKL